MRVHQRDWFPAEGGPVFFVCPAMEKGRCKTGVSQQPLLNLSAPDRALGDPAGRDQRKWENGGLQLFFQGLAHDVAVAEGGVKAHAVLLGVLLLDGAADVAGSVQAGDGFPVLGQDMAVGVDGQACGGQVEGGIHPDGPDAVPGLDVGAACAAELIGLAGQSSLIVVLDGGGQVGQGELLAGGLNALVVDGLALLEHGHIAVEAVRLAVLQLDGGGLVEDVVEGVAVVLVQLGVGHGVVVVGHDVADVVAVDVDHDAGSGGVDEGQLELALVAGQEGRQGAVLALHHAAGVQTQLDAVTGDAGGAVEEEVGVVGAVFLQHLGVLAETAGGQADGLGFQGVAGAVVALGVEAHHTAALILDQVGDAGGVDDLALLVGADPVGQEHHGVACAALVAAGGQVGGGGAVGGGALIGAQGAEADADAGHPVHQIARDGVLGGHVGHLAGEEVLPVILVHGLPEVHHAVQGAHGGSPVLAGDVEVVLQLGACGGHAAVGHGHGAAGDVPLLHQGDAVTSLQQAGGADQARGAGAHDDDVGLFLDHFGGGLHSDLSGEVVHIVAGQGDGLLDSGLDGHGGDGGAPQVGHVDALVLHDGGGDAGAGVVADADGLLVGEDLTGSDGAVGEGGGDVDPALVAHGLGDVLAVHRGRGDDRSGGSPLAAGSLGGGSGGGSGGGAAVVAAAQQAGSSHAHSAEGGAAHKRTTRNFAHSWTPFPSGSVFPSSFSGQGVCALPLWKV